ncbi:hypothetical protein [Paenibacillus sanfengchensis]|uniref:hypothetical protein n=1 Tax=Paenibacillus sanfengchensis TaxID=3119819 RepID=UPI002FE2DB59
MYYIKDAVFRRITEVEGTPCGEILVRPGAVGDADLFVYVARSSGGEYEIVRMVKSDADLGTDWYDNNMHQAYEEVAEQEFCSDGWPSPERQRAEFLQRLLADREIMERLDAGLPR